MTKIEQIQSALINSEFETLKTLLKDYDINSFDNNGNNILHNYLLSFSKIKIEPKLLLDLFISKGIDINKKQQKGNFKRSPLHISVFNKNKVVFNYLINLDIDINSTDKNGNNILSTSISRFNVGSNGEYFTKKIIELGGDLEQENNHGISPKTWLLRYKENEGPRKIVNF